MPASLGKVLYTARAHTTGGRDGASRTDDGRLDIALSSPGTSDLVVLAVSANPDPEDSIRHFDAERTVMNAGANRPEIADAFEVERRVARVCTKQLIVLVCNLSNLAR